MALWYDTIVAPATPLGESAIAIVRLSGMRAVGIVDGFASFGSGRSLADFAPRSFVSCVLRAGGEIIDHALCVRFVAPASFTGEDIVELHLHGNPLIVELVIRQAVAAGARMASAGEFSRRAFVNGKMDLTRLEGLAALLRAESEAALFQSQRQLHGELTASFGGMRGQLIGLLGFLELELDFGEEGYEFLARDEVRTVVNSLLELVSQLLASFRSGHRFLRGPRVLLLGSPNVGKSSLFNAMLGFSRALVSPIPGTTRDYLEERLNFDGITLHLIDSAGVRETDDVVESAGVRFSRSLIDSVDEVLYLVDSSSACSSDVSVVDLESANGPRFRTVYTKSDLVPPPPDALSCSVLFQESIRRLLQVLVSDYRVGVSSSLILLSERQFALLSVLQERLLSTDWSNADAEILSYELRSVLRPLDELSGAITTEDVLNEVFASFCIGK